MLFSYISGKFDFAMTGSESPTLTALRREAAFRHLCALQAAAIEAEQPLAQLAVKNLRDHGPELVADLLTEEDLLRICEESLG